MNKVVNMVFDDKKIEILKQLAREKSAHNKTDILYTDLIREAVDLVFFMERGGSEENKDGR